MENIFYRSNNGLNIVLDMDFLRSRFASIIQDYRNEVISGYSVDKVGLPTEQELTSILTDLCNTAMSIIKGDIDIFDCIPLTKAGKFSKSKSILVKTTNVKNVHNGDYFSMHILQLRLVPVPYYELCNPFSKFRELDYKGDGTTLYLELGYFNRSSTKEQAILSQSNESHKIEVVRNKYLKQTEIKEGYIYKDAKGNKFLYLGIDSEKWYSHGQCYKTDYYFYLKLTKKVESELCKFNDLLKIRRHYEDVLKRLMNPMKFTEEVGKLIGI